MLQTQPRTSLDTCGNLHFNLLFTFDSPHPATRFTGRGDHLSGTAAITTRSRNRKEALLKAHLAGALAGAACFRLGAGSSPRACARLASLEFWNTKLRSH